LATTRATATPAAIIKNQRIFNHTLSIFFLELNHTAKLVAGMHPPSAAMLAKPHRAIRALLGFGQGF
jgi:hypothetical protein